MPPWPIRIAVAWCTKKPTGVLALVIFGRDVTFVVVILRPGVALDQVEGPIFYLYGVLDTKAGYPTAGCARKHDEQLCEEA